MALFNVGKMEDFVVAQKSHAKHKMERTFGTDLSEDADASILLAEEDLYSFAVSGEPRGMAIEKITLKKGFEGPLKPLFSRNNQIYMIAYSWDFSGQPIEVYPGLGMSPESVMFNISPGTDKTFGGVGVNLFTKRRVKGGIAVRIQLFESDQSVRDFGRSMEEINKAVNESRLGELLKTGMILAGGPVAAVSLATEAFGELASVISKILIANGNDFVDFFQGYYPADLAWADNVELLEQDFSDIALRQY